MPRWSLRGLSKSYRQAGRDIRALDAVSLSIEANEFLVVLGPASAGKTTLLRLIAGLERPDFGQIYRDDTDITSWPVERRDVAMVFQNFAVYPHFTVYDNLAFPLRPHTGLWPKVEIEKRVLAAAEMLGIRNLLPRHPGTLSGGELQRVAIGRCLVRRPSLFLFDEPLVNLDAKLRENLRSELHRIQRETGIAMIYVTHDQSEAMTLADRMGVLDGGRLLQIGEPATVYLRPNHSRVARLLGMPPINLFTPTQAAALGLPVGEGRWAGLRPENIQVMGDPNGAGQIIATERFGHAEVLVIQAADQIIRAYVSGNSSLRSGEKIKLIVDASSVFWLPE
jgi:multiple sugar transport system ATP-binding protein